jgi:predicted nucleotidyltransferase
MSETRTEPVLIRFADLLRAEYGARRERAILFGTRARGDHRPDSGYDVAMLLHDLTQWWDEVRRLAALVAWVKAELERGRLA